MRILAVDVGTGTQDILLYDTELQPENCFKMVMPSPTMMVARQVKAATEVGRTLILDGVTMGGGPSFWAVRDHAVAGNLVFATESAARTFDDDLDKVRERGITVVDSTDVGRLKSQYDHALHLSMHDFDFDLIQRGFAAFDLELDIDGVAVAVFDHGAAPPDVSDRQFRFDYLDDRITQENRLSAFAFKSDRVPAIMTRLGSVVESSQATGMPERLPLMLMDTAPAAVLGATLDSTVAERDDVLVTNVGNFHTIAFRLSKSGIDGVFEHHTGFLDAAKLDRLVTSLADASLTHQDVFEDQGHGALVYRNESMSLERLVVTGPRRAMMRGSSLPTYFAVPFGDMMIAGCYGLVRAWADIYPGARADILESLTGVERVAPWELL